MIFHSSLTPQPKPAYFPYVNDRNHSMQLKPYHLGLMVISFVWLSSALGAQSQQQKSAGLNNIFAFDLSNFEYYRENVEEWNRAILGFRRDHQLSLSLGQAKARWQLRTNDRSLTKTYDTTEYLTKFQYSFHIPWAYGFGYFLGSSIGYTAATNSDPEFKYPLSYCLPGILVGLVYNVSPVLRILSGVEYYLERWDDLGQDQIIGQDKLISITSRVLELQLAFDIFFRLNWAVRLEGHERQYSYETPRRPQGLPLNSEIAKNDRWYGIGLLYHLF